MIGNILIVIALLWLALAVGVGFHAKGHNRSGIIWFFVVAITGIIGIAIYLLAITSAGSEIPDDSSTFDDTVARNGPSAVVGSVEGLIIGLGLSGLLVLSYESLDSIVQVSLIPILGFIIGLILGPIAESRLDISGFTNSDSVNLTWRKTLGLVGGGVAILIGVTAYSYQSNPPKYYLSIEDTSVRYNSDGGTVTVEMNNPREDSVTVEIETFVEVVEINGGVTGNRNERKEFSTFVSGISTIPAESNHQVELDYEVDEQDTLESLELSDSPASSFTIQTDDKS
jgi:hypothetical protein